ncbi:MAG: hypothetical protein HY758_06895 [Nitrospirae bacterium]|nr:hypothetical protein [Nitrospirota bacterium]
MQAMIYDVIITGSGPTGVASALSFTENGIIPLILDVGYEARNNDPLNCNFYEYRKSHDSFNLMIGENYEGLNNIIKQNTFSPKLLSPFMQFVIKNMRELSPVDEKGFDTVQSFAMGGLANAWGAGLYRCLDNELVNIPLESSELLPYYDTLTREIGISGDDDDLTPFWGSTKYLLKPLRLSGKSEKLYLKYKKRKDKLNANGIYIGRSRLCVLSENYHDRSSCEYNDLESWFPNLPHVYTPAITLKRLIRENKVIYRKSVLVKSWSRSDKHLTVHAEDLDNGSEISFKCKKLVLAAGTINSSRIVLNSKRDFKTRLPLFDNPLVQIPLIFPSLIGSKFEKDALGFENLAMVCELRKLNLRLKGSILELNFPARSVFHEMLPLSARDNLSLIRNFLPAALLLLLYFPSSPGNSGDLMLKANGELEIFSLPHKIDYRAVRKVIYAFLSIGVLTHSLFVKYAPPGHSIHYAGTLPMVEDPKQVYQCDKMGELYQEPGVHIVDGSLFSYIPAKNISFTLMANAMRIADNISGKITKQ